MCKLLSEIACNTVARLQMLKHGISSLFNIGVCHAMLSAKAGQSAPHFRPAIVPLLDLLIIYCIFRYGSIWIDTRSATFIYTI